ncbi:DNA polymerase III subunit delta' [Deinococcus yavapaiensis]|uniref:DNA polymerase-3 subunit delta n=1 Tax=Deinococcus yavapaiensis KR-236 TaxID=694435 RepID=A0A318S0A8_9DEIO|nr:DNA polymerase III subunit delta' [Deinococcus yavapaiensis]PYE48388.1 DNA polymerase-3 subunit delta' [Deinococcus yavapaiensis KR-236]
MGTADFGLIGHAEVLNAVRSFRGHALLLVGPARVGKRMLARVMAALFNCTASDAPCGRCVSCTALLREAHPDVMEIEPKAVTSTGKAARRKLIPVSVVTERRDEGREYERHVVEWLEVAPTFERRVVIVDGAEHLGDEAANAMLKVVEEPPHGAMFVFLAEEVRAVLPTIVSRTARFDVPPASDAEMNAAMARLGTTDAELLGFANGRPGVLIERARARGALEDARSLVDAVPQGMMAALVAAETLEKRFDADLHAEALRFVLASHEASVRVAADEALERLLAALEQYVSPSLAFQLFALELRAAFGSSI